MRKFLFFPLLALALAMVLQPLSSVSALSGSSFKPGRIIDDAVFFSRDGMSADQVQSFLSAKVPSCDTNGAKAYSSTKTRKQYAASKGISTPFTCLKSYKQDTPSRIAESGLCSALTAKDNRTAARIIDDVSRACGVSQKVLLVLLQKEQSLVTDDWPWPRQYSAATGFGCPDTADCDPDYGGFFYQVYYAARQFKRYARNADDYNHQAAANNNIRYHPNSSCGSSKVYIENQATAGLYNYTPYRPNKAALNNLYGTGDSCSAYGNRNFWRMYNDWFGSTYSNIRDIAIVGDFGGGGGHEVGLKRGSTYMYDLGNDGVVNNTFGIGRDTDKVIVGDWDGDGKDEIGLKRDNTYFFDNNNDGSADVQFGIGQVSDQTIIGDWDGDGTDNIGLKRSKSYMLDTDNDRTAEIYVGMGRATDQVIVGDWDGDGTDNIGLKRGSEYYLDTDGTDNKAEIVFGIGRATDQVIVGDWDGDGTDNIGLKRGSEYYLDTNNDRKPNIYLGLGRDSDQALVGDWDGNGTDQIGLKRYNQYYLTNNTPSVVTTFILGYY